MRHVSYAQALEAAVFEEMQRDSKVYYMGEDPVPDLPGARHGHAPG